MEPFVLYPFFVYAQTNGVNLPLKYIPMVALIGASVLGEELVVEPLADGSYFENSHSEYTSGKIELTSTKFTNYFIPKWDTKIANSLLLPELKEFAKNILDYLNAKGIVMKFLNNTQEDGLLFEFYTNEQYNAIEIFPDGEVAYLRRNGTKIEAWDLSQNTVFDFLNDVI